MECEKRNKTKLLLFYSFGTESDVHRCTTVGYAYVKNNPLKYLDAMGTTAVQRFTGGYVSYSISGRTDDYSVSYDNNSGFGNSGSTNYSHDNSGQYTTQNNLSGMSNANWDDGSYQEFNNGVRIYKENGSSPVVFNPSLDVSRNEEQFSIGGEYATKQSFYGEQSWRDRQLNAVDMFKTTDAVASGVAAIAKATGFKNVELVASGVAIVARSMQHSVEVYPKPMIDIEGNLNMDYIPGYKH